MKKSTYVTIAVIVVVIVAAVAALALSGKQKDKQLAAQYQDQPASQVSQTPGPYKTAGGNEQENDNFYIPGRVESLASLADPNKNATIVWIGAPWCTICHAIRPFIANSANKYADKVALKEIDFDSNPQIVSQMGLFGSPDFFVLNKQGAVVNKFGAVTQSTWEAQLEAASQIQ